MTTHLLPWILLLVLLALGAGYVLGRKAASRSSPPMQPAGPRSPESSQPVESKPSGRGIEMPAARASVPAVRPAPNESTPLALLPGVTSWAYQLQDLNIAKAAASPFDLLVVDYATDGSDKTALKPADLALLKQKPDGSRRLVIAYLSIGEAESYRYYWQPAWLREKPSWLLGENPDWEQNYSVCFWEPEWQNLICGDPSAYLDRIIAQGFDGIYLDKCDVTEDLREHFKTVARSRPDLDGDMTAFVQRLSAYAKAKRPGFIVMMQNAETLLERPELRNVIDAMGKEELLFGLDAAERTKPKGDIAWSRDLLNLMHNEGKPIFCVEYLENPVKIREAMQDMKQFGYILYIAAKDRELARLVPPPAAA